jgi:hypothetical protein
MRRRGLGFEGKPTSKTGRSSTQWLQPAPWLLWLLIVWPAAAQPQERTSPRLRLRWEAPQGCPTQLEVLSDVDDMLPDMLPATQTVDATAVVRELEAGRWSLALTVSGPGQGQRLLEAESCEALASATAMLLALMLHAEDTQTPPVAAPDPPPAADLDVPVARSPAEAAVITEDEVHEPSPPWRVGLAMAGLLEAGGMPEPAAGPTIGVEVAHGSLRGWTWWHKSF